MKTITEACSSYLAFPAGSALPRLGDQIRSTALIESGSDAKGSRELFPSSLSWSHDLVLLRVTLPDDERIVAARYPLYLPTEEELRAELEREREEAERVLRLTADDEDSETKESDVS